MGMDQVSESLWPVKEVLGYCSMGCAWLVDFEMNFCL